VKVTVMAVVKKLEDDNDVHVIVYCNKNNIEEIKKLIKQIADEI